MKIGTHRQRKATGEITMIITSRNRSRACNYSANAIRNVDRNGNSLKQFRADNFICPIYAPPYS